jgi:protein-S-isoprenylcysteine O-methyltransferase Ste14
MAFLVVEQIDTTTLILMVSGSALCLTSYSLRLAEHVLSYSRGRAVINFHLILVVTFFGYFGWGYWSAADPVKIDVPSSIAIPVGAALAAAGLGLFLYSELKKHGVGSGDQMVTNGIYARIRHPMYIGLILLHIGFPLTNRSFIALASTALWAAMIAVWTHFEELNLIRRFGRDYLEYRKRTWF